MKLDENFLFDSEINFFSIFIYNLSYYSVISVAGCLGYIAIEPTLKEQKMFRRTCERRENRKAHNQRADVGVETLKMREALLIAGKCIVGTFRSTLCAAEQGGRCMSLC